MTTTTPPPRPTKGERTRERILDVAFELFARSGYHAVSVRDIATAAGLTHAGVLKHFGGKDELLLQVLQRREEIESRDQDAQWERGDTFADVLVGTVQRGLDTPALVALFTKISGEATTPDHPSHEWFAARYRRLRAGLARAFRTALEQAEPVDPPVDPELASTQLLALLDGLQVQRLLEPDAVDPVAVVTDHVRRLGIPVRD